ncbi:hypothetical protein [Chitinophaga niabensis]|uniref:Uncharacterized protein n=1 Tax=Chitinophaga niabensis TaxID=536979 RepID=A0A1N6JZ97_9BACT|nr:hypothetical protein [Chitinophaga niabensis]SIO49573.1 hypothetical protein SAMN04488055_4740 [Chitinophaga niabensis]
MEPIAKRLKSFLQFKGLTTTAFTRTLEYNSCEKVARLFRVPGAKPSVDILEDIGKHFEELNLRWLITGYGEMLNGTSLQPVAKPETDKAAVEEQNPQLLFLQTVNTDDEYVHHQPFPSFLLKES